MRRCRNAPRTTSSDDGSNASPSRDIAAGGPADSLHARQAISASATARAPNSAGAATSEAIEPRDNASDFFDAPTTSQYPPRYAKTALHLVTLIGWVAVLNGCGYPPPDRVQILANTIPPGGSCTVSRGGQLIGHVDSTPGIVLVPNEEADYVVACRRNAYQEMGTVVHARTETTSPLYYFGSKELHSRGGASVTFTLVPSVAPRL
jgi:hypothetical protein